MVDACSSTIPVHRDTLAEIGLSFLDKLIRSGYWRGLNQPPDLGSLTRYVVRDIPCGTPSGAGVILLLESPNTIEVSRGYPLAGRSGADVTSVLGPIAGIPESPDDRPFGAVLQAATLDDRMKGFGVINVSQLPMQSAAYPYPVRRAFDAILFNKFKTLRHIWSGQACKPVRDPSNQGTVDRGSAGPDPIDENRRVFHPVWPCC